MTPLALLQEDGCDPIVYARRTKCEHGSEVPHRYLYLGQGLQGCVPGFFL